MGGLLFENIPSMYIGMATNNVYTLYLSSANTAGATPYSNATVISNQSITDAPASNITYSVDFDELFKGKRYKKVFVRTQFQTENLLDNLDSGTGGLKPTSINGSLLLEGLPNPNSNATRMVLGTLQSNPALPSNQTNSVANQNGFTGTVTGVGSLVDTSTASQLAWCLITATAETGFVDVGDTTGNYQPIVRVTGTLGTRKFLLPWVSTFVTGTNNYVFYREMTAFVGTKHYLSVDTTGSQTVDMIPSPTGRQNITVKLMDYTQTTYIPGANYILKLFFQCLDEF
jgi:hypothetical protein